METSEQIDQIATALAVAQGAILNPAKESENPHFRSRYADLAAGLNAVRKHLSQNGIAVIQATYMADDVMMLETRIMHKSGQWMTSHYPVCKFPTKHQEAGSALTYARRYSLFAMVGIAGDDDDGNDASRSETPAPRAIKGQTITVGQVEELQSMIVSVGADVPRFMAYLKVQKLEDLPASQFDRAMAALKAKEGQSNAA